MFADMIPMVISILDRELPLLAPTQISSLECTHNNNRSVIHLHFTHYCQNTEPVNVVSHFLSIDFFYFSEGDFYEHIYRV